MKKHYCNSRHYIRLYKNNCKTYIAYIIIILFLIPFTSFCQDKWKYEIQLSGGPSLSSIRYDMFFFPSKYNEIGLGGECNLYYRYIFNRNSIKGGVGFERLSIGEAFNATKWWNYLQIPILYQYNFGKEEKFFFDCGSFIAIPLSTSDGEYYENLNTGIISGIGRTFSLNNNWFISCKIENKLGLYNINKEYTYIDKTGKSTTIKDPTYTYSIILEFSINYRVSKN